MPRTHRPYPPEFRAEAVRLARGSEKAIRPSPPTWASRPRRCATGCGRRMPATAVVGPAT
jgi:hypothetical protein